MVTEDEQRITAWEMENDGIKRKLAYHEPVTVAVTWDPENVHPPRVISSYGVSANQVVYIMLQAALEVLSAEQVSQILAAQAAQASTSP